MSDTSLQTATVLGRLALYWRAALWQAVPSAG